MSEPLRKSYSKAEMEARAKVFMMELWGAPLTLGDDARNKWMERYGMLIHFIGENFPEDKP